MGWRESFTQTFGPGLFNGADLSTCLRILRANRFRVEPRFALRLMAALSASLSNSINGRIEKWRFARKYSKVEVPAPLFILGHFRSGTTHLHNLLTQDPRFAYPNLFQVNYPRIFLSTEAMATRMMQVLLPKTRFGLDNVRLQWKTPYEDEFALAGGHGISPYISFAFPAQRDYYDRYLTLHDLTDRERAEWIEHWRTFLQKLTWKYDRPLVLKSPCHTCRIKTILDVFPDAKFVNIHRNPFDVFRSTRHMIGIIDRYWAMQRAPLESWETRALHQYRQMYEVYFAERSLIPAGRLCETSYESLDADPVNQVRRIYESLELPDFAEFAPQLTEYVDGLAGYQKNKLPALSADDRAMVAREWAICFEQWEYATDTEERKADESE